MTSSDGSPPTPPDFLPVSVALVGCYQHEPEEATDFTVVLLVRGLDAVPDWTELAAASAKLQAMLKADPVSFFARSGWDALGAPAPKAGDEIEVVALIDGDFDRFYPSENENGRH